MRKIEDNGGGLGVRAVAPIAEICPACASGFKADVGAGRTQEFSSIGRSSAG